MRRSEMILHCLYTKSQSGTCAVAICRSSGTRRTSALFILYLDDAALFTELSKVGDCSELFISKLQTAYMHLHCSKMLKS